MKNEQISDKVLSADAAIYNAEGYRQEAGLTITDMGDIIAIGDTPHNKADLEISEGRIESLVADWYVTWE